jgi:hypothetical protein
VIVTVDHLLQMREGQRGGLRSQAVGDGAVAVLDGPVHPLAPPETLGGVAGEFGLDAEDLGVRAPGLDGRSDAGCQAAATDRNQHVLDVRHVVGDLQADRALPRDHVRMVEGRDQYATRLFHHLRGHLLALSRSAEHDLCAIVPWPAP